MPPLQFSRHVSRWLRRAASAAECALGTRLLLPRDSRTDAKTGHNHGCGPGPSQGRELLHHNRDGKELIMRRFVPARKTSLLLFAALIFIVVSVGFTALGFAIS